MMLGQYLNTHRIFKRIAKALIRLRVCVGWSESLMVAHTTLLEISCRGSIMTCVPEVHVLVSPSAQRISLGLCRNLVSLTKPQKNLCKTDTLKNRKLAFKINYRLMQVESIAECSKGSILQCFRPSLGHLCHLDICFFPIFELPFYIGFTVRPALSYHLSLRSLFCPFLRGRLTSFLLFDPH